MKSTKFKELFEQLNPNQKKAVDTIEGAVMVVAGPGTGKTQVLTLRIANILLKTDVVPENILALTFTESAVSNMRARLVSITGTPGYRVEINTFHGFCNDIIKSYPENFPHLIASESITDLEQVQVIEQIVKANQYSLLKPWGAPLYHVKSIRHAIDELKKEGVTADTLEDALKQQQDDFDNIGDLYHDKGRYKGEMKGKYQERQREIQKNFELADIYRKYQAEMITQKMYDFNDMLLEVLQALQNDKSLLLVLQEKYQYILVDEHQDTNTAQNKIIELLCSFYENPNLFVVGDEKQAIFRFQGASLENFIYFKQLYPAAQLISLTDNYRSNQTILDAASSLISQNSMANVLNPEDSLLTARASHQNQLVKVAAVGDYFGEYYFIAKDIQKRIEDGQSKSEIAVIARNNRDLWPLAEVLESFGVPFVLESEQNIFDDPQIKKLILLFKAIATLTDEAVITALHIDCLECQPMDVFKIMRQANHTKMRVIDILANPKLLNQLELADASKLEDFVEKLKSWQVVSHNQSFAYLFTQVFHESGLMQWVLKQPNHIELLDKFSSLYEDIKLRTQKRPDFSLADFMDYLELLQEHELRVKRTAKTVIKDAVRLMTAHKSKGLEYGYVYIINCFDGHWGNLRKHSSTFKIPWEHLQIKLKLGVEIDNNEDERRLFYVALTRAKQEIIITYSTRALDGKEQVPSQFIDEIHETYRQLVEVQEFEDDFLNHKEIIFTPRFKDSLPENKEFFKQIFLDRGLSYTAVSNYLKCPWLFFYQNLLRIPTPAEAPLIFGNTIHKALSDYLKSLQKGGPADLQYLLERYELALVREGLVGEELASYKAKGQKVLTAYYQNSASQWSPKLLSELFVKGVKLNDQIFLTGMIDMIEPITGTDNVIVYDFKTGKPKSRTAISGGVDGSSMEYNYRKQLVFYKLLLDNYQYKKWTVKEGVIDFVEPDTSGKYHRESFEITDADVDNLKKELEFVANQILNLEYWEIRCGNRDCPYCALREMTIR